MTTEFLDQAQPIRPDLDAVHAIPRPKYTVEWGTRRTDGALVIHLFPPIVDDRIGKWDLSYEMTKRLDVAIPTLFEVKSVNAGYEEDYDSFYIIVRGVIAPDLRLLVQRFLETIEGAPIVH